ncbi:MAG: hypothetical protein JKY65_12390 [Planctomycetes bacterium]|nr:hypothetical protein [Planctomycetota bacterium]
MSELLVPSHFVANKERPYGPFDRDFFASQFNAGVAPRCDLFADGEVPVVELQLANGETCDVFAFQAFEEDHIVAQLFDDPPDCKSFYVSFIRYETVFRVNIRYYEPPKRPFGFKPVPALVKGKPAAALGMTQAEPDPEE